MEIIPWFGESNEIAQYGERHPDEWIIATSHTLGSLSLIQIPEQIDHYRHSMILIHANASFSNDVLSLAIGAFKEALTRSSNS